MHNPHWLVNLNIVFSNEWPILHLYLKQSSLSMPFQPSMVPLATSSSPNNVHWSSSFTNVHLSGVYPLFMRIHFHFLQILLSELRIFRRIHSCRDQQHMFRIKFSFTFQFLSTDYFTSYSFVCSQDAQSLRICEDGHQIQQTPGSLSCDYITASRAGQMALFRMSIDIISSIGTDDIKLWSYKTLFISWNTEHAL